MAQKIETMRNLSFIVCLSLVRPVEGWILSPATEDTIVDNIHIATLPRSRVALSFVPVTNNEDLLRTVHIRSSLGPE